MGKSLNRIPKATNSDLDADENGRDRQTDTPVLLEIFGYAIRKHSEAIVKITHIDNVLDRWQIGRNCYGVSGQLQQDLPQHTHVFVSLCVLRRSGGRLKG